MHEEKILGNTPKIALASFPFSLLKVKPKRGKWYFGGIPQDFFMHRAYKSDTKVKIT